jgi:uncharacterized protein YkwD
MMSTRAEATPVHLSTSTAPVDRPAGPRPGLTHMRHPVSDRKKTHVTASRLSLRALAITAATTIASALLTGGLTITAHAETSNDPLPGLTFPAECSTWSHSASLETAGTPSKTVHQRRIGLTVNRIAGGLRVTVTRRVRAAVSVPWTGTSVFDACGNGYGVHDPYRYAGTVTPVEHKAVTLTKSARAYGRHYKIVRARAIAKANTKLNRAQARHINAIMATAATDLQPAARSTLVGRARNRALAGTTFPLPTTDQLAAAFLADTNIVRTAAGVPELSTMVVLTTFGRNWAQHLADTMPWDDFMAGSDAHSGAALGDFPDLMDCYNNGEAVSGVGENIAGFSGEGEPVSYLHPEAYAAFVAAIDTHTWVESPGHYNQLVDATWNRTGLGVAYTAGYQIYVTQDFVSDGVTGACSQLP